MMHIIKAFDYMNKTQEKYLQEFGRGLISKKQLYKKLLIISRITAQKTIESFITSMDSYNKLRRMQTRFKYQGVDIIPLNQKLKTASECMNVMKSTVGSIGGIVKISLDGWQEQGATYDEFFNFCCCSENTIKKMKQSINDGETLFSDLIGHHCPDYKYDDDFLDIHNYAPMTHSIREYTYKAMISLIKADKNAKDAIWDKLEELLYEREERNDEYEYR